MLQMAFEGSTEGPQMKKYRKKDPNEGKTMQNVSEVLNSVKFKQLGRTKGKSVCGSMLEKEGKEATRTNLGEALFPKS